MSKYEANGITDEREKLFDDEQALISEIHNN